jgi:hypothetical protein
LIERKPSAVRPFSAFVMYMWKEESMREVRMKMTY